MIAEIVGGTSSRASLDIEQSSVLWNFLSTTDTLLPGYGLNFRFDGCFAPFLLFCVFKLISFVCVLVFVSSSSSIGSINDGV